MLMSAHEIVLDAFRESRVATLAQLVQRSGLSEHDLVPLIQWLDAKCWIIAPDGPLSAESRILRVRSAREAGIGAGEAAGALCGGWASGREQRDGALRSAHWVDREGCMEPADRPTALQRQFIGLLAHRPMWRDDAKAIYRWLISVGPEVSTDAAFTAFLAGLVAKGYVTVTRAEPERFEGLWKIGVTDKGREQAAEDWIV